MIFRSCLRSQEQCRSDASYITDELEQIFKLQRTNVSNWIVENKVKRLCCEYGQDNSGRRKVLLQHLATKYNVSQESVFYEAKKLLEAKQHQTREKLKELLTPAYRWLFVKISRLEGGVKFLVDLRASVLVRRFALSKNYN